MIEAVGRKRAKMRRFSERLARAAGQREESARLTRKMEQEKRSAAASRQARLAQLRAEADAFDDGLAGVKLP